MANFNGTARSNYFKVKDIAAFDAWVESVPGLVSSPAGDMQMIYSDDPDEGCFPAYYYDEATDESIDIDLISDISEHLADGEVCVLMEAGAEKLRYISGWAVAFDNTDKPAVRVSLNDIYDLAKAAFGVIPTDASY